MVTSTSTPGSKLMLVCGKKKSQSTKGWSDRGIYDLLDDLTGGVEINETLVDLELVTVPGLRTLTARL